MASANFKPPPDKASPNFAHISSAAHVAGCRYDAVFADIMGATNPEGVPPISKGLLGVTLGKRATDRILRIVAEATGDKSSEPLCSAG